MKTYCYYSNIPQKFKGLWMVDKVNKDYRVISVTLCKSLHTILTTTTTHEG